MSAGLQAIAMRWNRFWYAKGNTLNLGLFRVMFAGCLFWEVEIAKDRNLFAVEGGFHLPYLSFVPLLSPEVYAVFHDWQYPFIALLGVGVLTRSSCAALIFLQGYTYFADQLNFRNHAYLFLLILLLLLFSPCSESLSLSALIRRWKAPREGGPDNRVITQPLTIQRLLQLQVSIAYFYAALHKMVPEYLGGQVLANLMVKDLFSGRSRRYLTLLLSPGTVSDLQRLAQNPEAWIALSWITVGLELGLAFALWIPRARVVAIMVGIPFHLSIAFVMSIDTFSAAMIASYLLFLDPDTLPAYWGRFRQRFGLERQTARKTRTKHRRPRPSSKRPSS